MKRSGNPDHPDETASDSSTHGYFVNEFRPPGGVKRALLFAKATIGSRAGAGISCAGSRYQPITPSGGTQWQRYGCPVQ